MRIEVTTKQMALLECFSSETRVQMIELLNERPMNIRELADALGLSSAIITKHVQKMEEGGILACENIPGKRGTQKICSLRLDQITLQLKSKKKEADRHQYTFSIPVGQYTAHEVKPTCGLASCEKLVGMLDDPRYFAAPEHVQANLLWFGSGYVEYRIPNFLLVSQTARSLELSLEICSEAPGFNEQWPSDICFYVNGVFLGMWTCPGDYGETRGVFTPEWWRNRSQYGLLKTVLIGETGSFLDGVRLSDVSIHDLGIASGSEITFRLACQETAEHCGGISLFGKHFGNYDQDIAITMTYGP